MEPKFSGRMGNGGDITGQSVKKFILLSCVSNILNKKIRREKKYTPGAKIDC